MTNRYTHCVCFSPPLSLACLATMNSHHHHPTPGPALPRCQEGVDGSSRPLKQIVAFAYLSPSLSFSVSRPSKEALGRSKEAGKHCTQQSHRPSVRPTSHPATSPSSIPPLLFSSSLNHAACRAQTALPEKKEKEEVSLPVLEATELN